MFDSLKNLGNLGSLMSRAREMQDKMKSMQDEMGRKTVVADAGGGIVEATVNGRLELIRIRIDKTKLVDPTDTEMLEDVIVAATQAAQAKAAQMMQSEMQKMAADMGLPPGMLPG